MRSVLYNLKDDKNQDFRGKVLRGEVPPAKICTMEPHDMASEVCCPFILVGDKQCCVTFARLS